MKRPKPIIIGPRLKRGKKRKSKPREIEKPIHVSILSYLRVTLLQGSLIHHSPNELGINSDEAARAVSKAKEMGMRPGWPDIEFIARQHAGSSIFAMIEVKSDVGELSARQKQVRHEAIALGIPYCVARSIKDVQAFLEWEGIDMRSRLT